MENSSFALWIKNAATKVWLLIKKRSIVSALIIASILAFVTLITILVLTGTNRGNKDNLTDDSSFSEGGDDGGSTSDNLTPDDSTSDSPAPDDSSTSDTEFFTASFRSDSGATIGIVSVAKGKCVQVPEDPTQDHSEFLGWYADEGCNSPFDFSAPILADTVIYSKWKKVSYCNIESLEFDLTRRIVTVSVTANTACTVVIRLIDEEKYFGGSYAQGDCYVEGFEFRIEANEENSYKTEKTAMYEAFIPQLFPEYFVAEAVALSVDETPISNSFVTIDYSLRYEIFKNTTVNDFDKNDTVLKFREEDDNNFGVLADDVTVIIAANVVEEYYDDNEMPIYRITSPSRAIAAGDKIYVSGGDGEMLAIVDKVENVGDVYKVTPLVVNENNAQELSNFYKFLKVDAYVEYVSTDENEESYVTSTASTVSPAASLTRPMFSPDFKIKKGDYEVEGEIQGTVTYNLFVVYAPSICGENYFSIEYVREQDLYTTTTFTLTKEVNVLSKSPKQEKGKITIIKGEIPIGITGLTLYGKVDFELSYGITGTVCFNSQTVSTEGFSFNTVNGGHLTNNYSSFSDITKCEGSAFIGAHFKGEVGISVLLGIIKFSIDGSLGIEIRGTADGLMVVNGDSCENNDHLCELCIDGGVFYVWEIGASVKINVLSFSQDDGSETEIVLGKGIPSIGNSKKLFGFYASLISDGDFEKYGRGKCPNRGLLVTIDVYPYFESCYVTYDPITGEKTFGSVTPNGDFNYPSELRIYSADSGKLIAKSYCLKYLNWAYPNMTLLQIAQEYGTSLIAIAIPQIDEDDNLVYRITLPLKSGNYRASVLYGDEEMGHLNYLNVECGETIYSNKTLSYYSEKVLEDYGDVVFSVPSIGSETYKTTQNVRVFPENSSYTSSGKFTLAFGWECNYIDDEGNLRAKPYNGEVFMKPGSHSSMSADSEKYEEWVWFDNKRVDVWEWLANTRVDVYILYCAAPGAEEMLENGTNDIWILNRINSYETNENGCVQIEISALDIPEEALVVIEAGGFTIIM